MVVFTAIVEGSVEEFDEFDERSYRSRLASILPGVSAEDIALTLESASIRVTASLHAANESVAASSAAVLLGLSPANLSSVLHVRVEAVTPPVLDFQHKRRPPSAPPLVPPPLQLPAPLSPSAEDDEGKCNLCDDGSLALNATVSSIQASSDTSGGMMTAVVAAAVLAGALAAAAVRRTMQRPLWQRASRRTTTTSAARRRPKFDPVARRPKVHGTLSVPVSLPAPDGISSVAELSTSPLQIETDFSGDHGQVLSERSAETPHTSKTLPEPVALPAPNSISSATNSLSPRSPVSLLSGHIRAGESMRDGDVYL